jgi:hypothetical protein
MQHAVQPVDRSLARWEQSSIIIASFSFWVGVESAFRCTMEKAPCEWMTDHGPCLGYAKGGQRLCRAHLGQFNEFFNDRGEGVKQGIAQIKQSLRDAQQVKDMTEQLLACLEPDFQVHTAPAQSSQRTPPPLGYHDAYSTPPAGKLNPPVAARPATPELMPSSFAEGNTTRVSTAPPKHQRTDETHVPITTVSPELLTAAARRYSMIDGLVVSALVSRMNASQKSNCVVIDPSTASRFLIRDDATAPELRVREDTAAEVTRSRRAAIVAHVGHPEAGHYICICVDPAERKVVVYDSLPTVDAFSVTIANIAHAVQSRIPGSAELTYAVGYTRQAAGSNDCALYALNQAWRFTSGGEFGLTRDNIRDRLTDAAHALPTPSAPPQQGPFADTRPPARPSPEGMEHSPATAPTVTALQKNALKCAGAERTARGVAEVEEATSRMRIESARSRANRPLCGAETESGRCTYPPRPGKTTCDRHDPDLAVPEQDSHRTVAAWEAEVQLLKSQIDARERLLPECWTRVEIIKQLHWHEQQHQQHQHTPPPLGYLDANSPLPARKLRTPRKHLAGQRESSRIADASTTTCVARFEKAQTPAEWHRIAMGRREHLTADDVEKLRRRVSACGPGCVLYAVWKADDYCYFGRAPVVERNGSLFLQFDRVGDLPPDLPLDGQLHPSRHSTLLWVQVFARDTRHPCVVAPDAFAPSRGRDTMTASTSSSAPIVVCTTSNKSCKC